MRCARLITLALLLHALPAPANAHEVLHEVEDSKAIVVRLFFADGSPFSYESCEARFEDEDVPYLVGFTDANGRFAFVPDRAGTWRIQATSEDGHGTEVTLEVDASLAAVSRGGSLADRFLRIVAGVGLLLGIFGVLSLTRRRRER
jgi:nickel transport protein